jgi:hypothetical protein
VEALCLSLKGRGSGRVLRLTFGGFVIQEGFEGGEVVGETFFEMVDRLQAVVCLLLELLLDLESRLIGPVPHMTLPIAAISLQ